MKGIDGHVVRSHRKRRFTVILIDAGDHAFRGEVTLAPQPVAAPTT